MRWQELLAATPEDAGERAARARRRALAKLDETGPQRRRTWWWVPALAVAALVVTAGVRRVQRVETLEWQPAAPVIARVELAPPAPAAAPVAVRRAVRRRPTQQRLEVQLALSDGTRVYWTFDNNFSLRGTL